VDGFLADVADDGGGFGAAEAAAVGGGEVESVDEGVGALLGDDVGGQRVDDDGDGDLDGGGVFEFGQGEGAAVGGTVGVEVALSAVGVVGAVEPAVEVTEGGSGEGYGSADEAVRLDVATEVDLHGCSLYPPGGWVVSGLFSYFGLQI
jgi:hypothetical protein